MINSPMVNPKLFDPNSLNRKSYKRTCSQFHNNKGRFMVAMYVCMYICIIYDSYIHNVASNCNSFKFKMLKPIT